MILQNFKIAILQNVGEQPFLKVDYHIIFMINKIDLFVVSAKFHSIGNIFPFWDQIFSWNEKTILVLMSNVCYFAVISIF